METKHTTPDMGSASVPKLMLKLAIPAVIAQLINMLYNIVDRAYSGCRRICVNGSRTVSADFNDDQRVCDAGRFRRRAQSSDFHG